MLRSATSAAPAAAASVVIAQIKAEHRALLQVLGAMQALVGAGRAGGAKPQRELFGAMLSYVEALPGRLHASKEDQVLFTAVALRSRQGRELTSRLRRERAGAGCLIANVRAALARFDLAGPQALEGLASAVEELAELTWWRVKREEEELLPLAQAILPEAAWREIAACFAMREAPSGKEPVPA